VPSNIGIAFEDVISCNSDLWSDFMEYTRLEGHSIFVISECLSYTVTDQLEYHGLFLQTHWDRILSVFSFLSSKGADVYFDSEKNSWQARNQQIWYNAKARMCFEQKIAIMFESKPQYFAAFDNIATRLINVEDEENFKMIEDTAKRLKVANSWFKD
jgi:hypothetical protein